MTEITLVNHTDVILEVENAFKDIPFDNSKFQIDNFVVNSGLTPERIYRSIGLNLITKLQALRKAVFDLERQSVDVDELNYKIEQDTYSEFDKRRFAIDIKEKLSSRSFQEKLISDTIVELNILYEHFKNSKKYTREEFEAGEKNHFTKKLSLQLDGITGAKESMLLMQDLPKILSAMEAPSDGGTTWFSNIAKNY